MALIKCPECEKDVSDKAKSCIHCGCPMTQLNKLDVNSCENILVPPNNKQKKMVITIILITITLIVASFILVKPFKKPVFRNLHWEMKQAQVVKSEGSHGEMYKDVYIIDNQISFNGDCSIVCGFDESSTLNKITVIFDNTTYSNYSDIFNQLYKIYGNPYLIEDKLNEKYIPYQKTTWLLDDTTINLLYGSGEQQMVYIGYSPTNDKTQLEAGGVNFNDGNTQCSAKSAVGGCENTALLWNDSCEETGCQIIGCDGYVFASGFNDKGLCVNHYTLVEDGIIEL